MWKEGSGRKVAALPYRPRMRTRTRDRESRPARATPRFRILGMIYESLDHHLDFDVIAGYT